MKSTVVSVLDVAQYIVDHRGPVDALKLEKLVYYCQAWAMVWLQRPLFHERIEAWRDGPVVPQLFNSHRGRFSVSEIQGGSGARLSPDQKDVVDSVLGYYGNRTAAWLSERTHAEDPWRNARRGLLPFQAGHREITLEALRSYYSDPARSIQP